MGRNVLVGLSVVDSIKQCIRLDNGRAADDFKRSFGVTDKYGPQNQILLRSPVGIFGGSRSRHWLRKETGAHWKPSPCPRNHRSDGSRSSKQPCPTMHLLKELKGQRCRFGCQECMRPCLRFIDRLPDSEEKVEFYTKVGLNLAAAKTAANLQNVDLLTKIQGMMGTNTQFGMRTATMIERLKGQGPSQP